MNMNKRAFISGLLSFCVFGATCGCSSFSALAGKNADEKEYVKATIPASSYSMSKDIPSSNGKAEFKPFFVYTDEKSKQNHYYPSGWMGDTQDLKFSGAYQNNPVLGKTCLRVTYLAKGPKQWAGIYWQNPPNNWGGAKGGYDLRGATAITFWVRGEKGGEKISEFKIGGLTGKNPDSDVAWIGPVTLKSEWTQYRINLAGKDMRYVNGGFCFTVLQGDNPKGCTFYIDEIRYE